MELFKYTWKDEFRKTYTISLLIEHKGSNSPPSIGTVTGLTMDTDGSMAPTILILSSGNGASGRWHG